MGAAMGAKGAVTVPVRAGGVQAVPAGKPDRGSAVGGVLGADEAVREVVRSPRLLLGPATPCDPGVSIAAGSRGRPQPLKPLTVGLVTIPLGPSVTTPTGTPTVFELDALSGVDNVLDVAVLSLEEVDPLPHVRRKIDRGVRPNAHDEIGAEKPHDMPPEAAVHLAPRRGGPGRVRPLGARTAAAAAQDASHSP